MIDRLWTFITPFSGFGWVWMDIFGRFNLWGHKRENTLPLEVEALRWEWRARFNIRHVRVLGRIVRI